MENICYNCFRSSVDERGICTECGFHQKENHEKYPMALPAGSILYGQYIVGKVLGQGGFGITYLAQDYQTKELVAIKEFFPDIMATRTNSITVTPFSGERGENFTFGKNSFLDEAKTMAEFNGNLNIVEVYSYFEENGTGYFVMEYIDGCSLQEYIKTKGGRLSWDETVELIRPILNALSAVHEKGIIHRDVTPDNIYITKDGAVKLLDFGAARYSLGNVSRSLDVVLKHGFAPKEQYKRHGRQGPYTDIYSVGATIYYALTGVRPDDSIERSDEDTMPLPSQLGAKIAGWQETVILKAMSINPEDRYQSAKELRTALMDKSQSQGIGVRTHQKPQTHTKKVRSKWMLPGVVTALVLSIGIFAGSRLGGPKEVLQPTEPAPEVTMAQLQETVAAEEIVLVPQQTYTLKELEYDAFAEPDELTLWGQNKYTRADVETIRFQSTLEDTPLGAFDVSENQDGTIWAWMDGGNLTVAANGRIALPKYSSFLFSNFIHLRTVDFGNCVDTSNVETINWMFADSSALTVLDLSGFDTSSVTSMENVFHSCSKLTSLDLSGWDTSSVSSMAGMFYGCSGLTSLDLSSFNTSNVTDMGGMFASCSALASVDLSGFNTSNVTNMVNMFSYCTMLTSLQDVTYFDTSRVSNMGGMFGGCKALTELDLSGWNNSCVTDMGYMFSNCESLTILNLYDFGTRTVTDMTSMFFGCKALTGLDVTGFDTSNVTDMYNMFSGCSGLTSLDLSGFNTSKVVKMGSMFSNCSGLTSLNLSGFNTSLVEDMDFMFLNCSGLTSLDLSGFNTASIKEMNAMFDDCFPNDTTGESLKCTDWKIRNAFNNR